MRDRIRFAVNNFGSYETKTCSLYGGSIGSGVLWSI